MLVKCYRLSDSMHECYDHQYIDAIILYRLYNASRILLREAAKLDLLHGCFPPVCIHS